MSEAKDIVSKLQAKHGGNYMPEQLHAWAQLIQCKKHQSHDQPPNFPFVKASHSSKKADATDQSPIKQSMSLIGISPGKCINLRTECIEQLHKVADLLEKGSISQEQHDQLHGAIMKDIEKF